MLEPEVQVTKIWESAGFMRRVSAGMYYRTIHDLDDGFGDTTAACRADTLPPDDPKSDIKLWIKSRTSTCPDLQVLTTCYLNIYGIEIQIPSTSGNGSNSWIFITRGANRYVEELRHNDPDYSPEIFELANYRSTEETHARQPTTHSRFQHNPFEDSIQITERNWIDITANEYCNKHTLETSISKLVMKSVRHFDLQERESDGTVHWKSMGPKSRHLF